MNKFLYLLCLTIVFFSCGKKDVEESTSRFMIVHASPNTPDMEFLIDDKPIIVQPLAYTSNIYYRDILSGTRNLKVVISGNTYIDTNMNFEKDAMRSFFFYDKPIQLKMKVVDDILTGASGGKCRVRFYQFVPDATVLDLLNTLDNSVVFSNTNLGDSKGWKNIPAGIYNWQLRNSSNQNAIYTDWRPDTLEAGKNYTIISNGFSSTMTNDTIGVWPIANGDFLP